MPRVRTQCLDKTALIKWKEWFLVIPPNQLWGRRNPTAAFLNLRTPYTNSSPLSPLSPSAFQPLDLTGVDLLGERSRIGIGDNAKRSGCRSLVRQPANFPEETCLHPLPPSSCCIFTCLSSACLKKPQRGALETKRGKEGIKGWLLENGTSISRTLTPPCE
ncbi:hypothetical protein Nepgr_016821 [Nepenthes gracilis]|uniref:Uncharacterized protein n=1 Tax=Nepenthes gracilis TaxID=150966 RepID=A0AAD3SQE4_NEPGR|nr:hypothetical protein Nepgr_016821 [Nepenthes gracilis]